MKPNLEISLKFLTILIIAFAIVLSIPFCDYLFNNHLMQHIYVTGLIICSLLFLASSIDLLLRNIEIKSKLKTETFLSKCSFETIEGYETQIKEQEDHIKELKKSFEDAVEEITELRSKNGVLKCKVNVLQEQVTYWKERSLHQKHTKKEIESEWFLCIKSIGDSFIEGNKYKKCKSNNNLLHLSGENYATYIVDKKCFKPVTNGN